MFKHWLNFDLQLICTQIASCDKFKAPFLLFELKYNAAKNNEIQIIQYKDSIERWHL